MLKRTIRIETEEKDDEKIEEKEIIEWCIRPTKELFQKSPEGNDGDTSSLQSSSDTVLKKSLSTGGVKINSHLAHPDFIIIKKLSSVSISRLVFTLCVGMEGSIPQAVRTIAHIAENQWSQDTERALKLYELIKSNDGVIDEPKIPSNLLVNATISQTVEHAILSDCCRWLGVDPDMDISRKKGRPPGSSHAASNKDHDSARGQIIELTLHGNDSLSGILLRDYDSLPKNQSLGVLPVLRLIELLGKLKLDEFDSDSELLEAYIESRDPDWRENATAGLKAEPNHEDPYSILGVNRDCSLEEAKVAYRKIMHAFHTDKNSLPVYFSQVVNKAYKLIKTELKE